MNNVASTIVFVTGLAVLGCGGAQQSAADPSTAFDEDRAQHEEDELNKAENEAESSDWRASESFSDTEPQAEIAQKDEEGAGECRESNAMLKLIVDRESVSLEQGRLQAKMDGPICQIEMRITRKDGLPAVVKAFRYSGPQREMRWDPVPRDQIEKIEVRIASDDGSYRSVFLVPWSVSIDHKEVEFDTNKAVIRPSEVSSLEDSYIKIKDVLDKVEGKELGTITLFIAGHTDTRGSDEHNMTLSTNRALAIAAWFKKRGLCIPIAFEGFGETALKKMTGDEVDAQENRRADYILAVEPPTMAKKGGTPAWKWISQGY